MRVFRLSNHYEVVCTSEKTRSGFRHRAVLCKDRIYQVFKAKICYYNRTWERFQFESVLEKVISGYFSGKERAKFLKVLGATSDS